MTARSDSARGAAQTPLWLACVLLALVAGLLLGRQSTSVLPAAVAQTAPMAGARGVYAFTGEIDQGQYGLFMLDIEQGTVWCYEIETVSGTRKLRLMAARSWIYDRYLRDFNCAEPSHRTVQKLIAQQRSLEPPLDAKRDFEDNPPTNPGGAAPQLTSEP
ncbi:MAG: hypothetical protein D6744_04080 [Planctomycetota bacterium]|nr:MAG: hypothetical protein D6744_04080 [Planctomycetota bacterium]